MKRIFLWREGILQVSFEEDFYEALVWSKPLLDLLCSRFLRDHLQINYERKIFECVQPSECNFKIEDDLP